VSDELQYAGTLDELKRRGRLVVRGSHRPILLIHDRDRIFALDNRCPHMGFPLERGSVEDGILTCHWHHARFDLASGCTFDLWADEVPTCPVVVRGGEIWVKPQFGPAEPAAYWRLRLQDGMAHNLGLVIAKAVQGQLAADVAPLDIVRQAALFGAEHLDGWTSGMTILTALGYLIPMLPKQDAYLALFHGARHVARDCDGATTPRKRSALASRPDASTLKRWLRHWSAVRHAEAARRTLLTAIAADARSPVLADLLFAAETDRVFADGGHSLDFINKAFECLDLIGWQHAGVLLPGIVGPLVAARGAEESTEWRQPADLIALCNQAASELSDQVGLGGARGPWSQHAELAEALLADDAQGVVAAVISAARDGASGDDLGRSLSYAAALRVARFGGANEHGDWESAHHVFTFCNAVHQGLKRIGDDPERAGERVALLRGVLHGAVAIYLIRYLNVPPARLPGECGDRLDDLPADAEEIRAALLEAFDRQQQVEPAARLVARHLAMGHAPELIISTLAHALLREDAGFHAYQMLEAGVRQFHEWDDVGAGRHILIAATRYLAAHSPTERSWLQTAAIAERLARGDQLYENI
jgi:nitrite reductase/ring-hydroxylating ferredoxin subunit